MTDHADLKYKRVLLKISGEALMGEQGYGIDVPAVTKYAEEIKGAIELGCQICLVIGGGNIWRGKWGVDAGMERAQADHMGMLGTVINALALKEQLIGHGVDCRVMSAIEIRAVAEPFIRGRALRHMDKGRVVILAAGTGNPFFTTDTCAALRATELECDILLKATKVDGVYTADPKKDPTATRFDELTFAEAMARKLRVMDMTALAMCGENQIPVLIFDFKKRGNIQAVVRGERIGTLLHSS